MFRASSCLSSGATTTTVAASGVPSELGDSSAVGRGQASWRPARPRPTALLSQSSDGKPEAATAVVVAPDDEHEDAQNVLLSPSSDGKPEAVTAVVAARDDGHEDARNMLSCI